MSVFYLAFLKLADSASAVHIWQEVYMDEDLGKAFLTGVVL